MSMPTNPDEEHEFYADPANQTPTGPPVRRRPRLSEPVPVRFPKDLLDQVRRRPQKTTAPSPTGSAGPSNTNWAARPADPTQLATNNVAARPAESQVSAPGPPRRHRPAGSSHAP
jgi:hypothetical protein